MLFIVFARGPPVPKLEFQKFKRGSLYFSDFLCFFGVGLVGTNVSKVKKTQYFLILFS